MSALGALYDIVIEQGSDWSFPMTYEVGDPPEAVDLTGPDWSVEVTFWDASGVRLHFGLGPAVSEIADTFSDESLGGITVDDEGDVTLSITEEGSWELTSSGRWAWRIFDEDGVATPVMHGKMTVYIYPRAGQLAGGQGT